MTTKKRSICTILMFMFLSLSLGACVTVPREAPDLSIELGKRLSAIETANIELLHKYFDEKRDKVDSFVIREWVPLFAENFFGNPQIEAVWNQVVTSGSKADRLEFVVKIGPELQKKINAKRLELIKPLDDTERLVELRLRDEFVQARAINNSITSFLVSAEQVAESRNRYLQMLGVGDDEMAVALDTIDNAVDALLSGAGSAETAVKRGENYYRKFEEVKSKLTKREGA